MEEEDAATPRDPAQPDRVEACDTARHERESAVRDNERSLKTGGSEGRRALLCLGGLALRATDQGQWVQASAHAARALGVLLYRSRLFNPRRAAGHEGAAVRVAGRRRSVAAAPIPRAPSGHVAGGDSWGAVGVAGQRDQGWRSTDVKQSHMRVAVYGQWPAPSIPKTKKRGEKNCTRSYKRAVMQKLA